MEAQSNRFTLAQLYEGPVSRQEVIRRKRLRRHGGPRAPISEPDQVGPSFWTLSAPVAKRPPAL